MREGNVDTLRNAVKILKNVIDMCERIEGDVSELYDIVAGLEESAKVEHTDRVNTLLEEYMDGIRFGDVVYVVNTTRSEHGCVNCASTGWVPAKYGDEDVQAQCPVCKGAGKHVEVVKTPLHGRVREIWIHVTGTSEIASGQMVAAEPYATFTVGNIGGYRLHEVYKTRDECKRKCKELNEVGKDVR